MKRMALVFAVAFSSALQIAFAVPRPQEVSVDEILDVAGNAARYGNSEEQSVDQSLLDDVFGAAGTVRAPASPINQTNGYGSVNEIVDTSSDQCSFYANQGYECVPYYNCEDGEIVTDGGGLIDIRSNFGPSVLDPGASKCKGYLEVCCRHPEFSTRAPVITTTTSAPIIRTPPPFIPQCGRRNEAGIGVRILNSKLKASTQFGEWPHMCAVLEEKQSGTGDNINLYACGASLIEKGIILTAAHCVDKFQANQLKIRCGEWDTQQVVEPREHEDRYVQRIVKHPLYNPKNLHNDFALLFLTEDFVLSPHIDTICLPTDRNSFQRQDCVATGWGKDTFGKKGEYQVIMKQVEMDIVSNPQCENRLRRTRLGDNFKLDNSFLCAGGERGKDTCKGDGGGPLVCPVSVNPITGVTRYAQAGIVAWGIDCGINGNPGVYASVADSLCFIHWATRCSTGFNNLFGIQNCDNWADHEILRLEQELLASRNRLSVISSDGSGTSSNLRNLQRRIFKEEAFLNNFVKVRNECSPRRDDNGSYGGGSVVEPIKDGSYSGGDGSVVEPIRDGDSYGGQGTVVEPIRDGDSYGGQGTVAPIQGGGGSYGGTDNGSFGEGFDISGLGRDSIPDSEKEAIQQR